MKKRAVFLAQKFDGSVHEIINTSILYMLSKTYDEVSVFAPIGTIENLKEQLRLLNNYSINLSFHPTHYCAIRKPSILLPFVAIQYFKASIYSAKDCDIFISSYNPIFILFSNFLSRINRQKFYHICHMDLELLRLSKRGKIDFEWRIIRFVFKNHKLNKSNKLIVLGDSIKNNLKKYMNQDDWLNNVLSIIHPYYLSNDPHENLVHKGLNGVLKIGIVNEIRNGQMKHLSEMNALVENFPNIEVHSISRRKFDIASLHNIINDNPNNVFLERCEYNKFVAGFDYIYYPYDMDSYKLGPSGAIYEAIVNGKPFVAPFNDYFDWLIKKFGDIGFLYKTSAELELILTKISSHEIGVNPHLYEKVRNYLNPQYFVDCFSKVIFGHQDENTSC